MTNIKVLDVIPGDRVVLINGAEAVVTHNPDDGLWLFGRYVTHPEGSAMVNGREYSLFSHEVKDIFSSDGNPK